MTACGGSGKRWEKGESVVANERGEHLGKRQAKAKGCRTRRASLSPGVRYTSQGSFVARQYLLKVAKGLGPNDMMQVTAGEDLECTNTLLLRSATSTTWLRMIPEARTY
ncbi:hypothetical protein LIA77_00421 [Sarocladium implicatum]|nr:hypothetical protein LIA77_00421 [Sarocladium implicatum]